jgi:DNA-binding NtrC family response regulator
VAIGDQSISLAALKAVAPLVQINEHTANLSLKQATRQASFEVERQLISQVLRATGGNRKRAARELGISYKALLYKIRQIGLADPSAIRRFGVAI